MQTWLLTICMNMGISSSVHHDWRASTFFHHFPSFPSLNQVVTFDDWSYAEKKKLGSKEIDKGALSLFDQISICRIPDVPDVPQFVAEYADGR